MEAVFLWLIPPLVSYPAQQRLTKYWAWKRQWDAHGESGASAAMKLPGMPSWLRVLLGGGVWIIAALWALAEADNPALAIPQIMFWAGTLLGIIVGVRRLFRRTRRPASARVAVCLGVPAFSATAAQAFQALPAYCLQIMRR